MAKKPRCSTGKCTKKKMQAAYTCIKCHLPFCSWHLLFLKELDKKDTPQSIDASQAQCLCCFFGIERAPDFNDPAIADELAQALLQKDDPVFRDRVLEYRRGYEHSEVMAFAPGGPQYWWPMMAPPPDADVKEFITHTQQTR